ncbi:hypothetical protein ACWEVP_03515 [Amycolatopsis sp. NPDC003865]
MDSIPKTTGWRSPIWPWMAARYLFGPQPPHGADESDPVARARSILGFAITVWAFTGFGAKKNLVLTDELTSNAEVALGPSVGATVIVGSILLIHQRCFSLESCWPVFRALAALETMLFAIVDDKFYATPGLIGFAATLAAVWCRPFELSCLVFWYWYPFGSSRHVPLLSPVVTGITVEIGVTVSLLGGTKQPVPYLLWLVVTVSGAVSSLALVGWEVIRLPDHHA